MLKVHRDSILNTNVFTTFVRRKVGLLINRDKHIGFTYNLEFSVNLMI